MKTLKFVVCLLAAATYFSPHLVAQDDDMTQAFWVHEDRVYPKMAAEYESVSKELVDLAQEHEVEGSWIAMRTEDYRYISLSPIANMADLDKRPFAKIAEKMGKENFGKVFDRFDACYDNHGSYILVLDKELSYQPTGINTTPAGKDYRAITYYHFKAADTDNARDLAMKFKKLYTDKGSELHYRVYRSGFGVMGQFYMVAVAAESAEAYEKMQTENRMKLGAEGAQLFGELQEMMLKVEYVRGTMLPDQGYSSSN
ncbi:MAG: hypothetical protein HKN87_16655 [Saprospiraceae bacterium]|nr:hypothetical protein [Saprospiraceae bacterium]